MFNEPKLFKCRLGSKAWTGFTGSMGFGAMFKDGESVEKLTARQIARIGSTTLLLRSETGEQVGPSALHNFIQDKDMDVQPTLKTVTETNAEKEDERERLVAEEEARKAEQEKALEEARQKAEEDIEDGVVYSRDELEAIGANDGISGLREIAEPLGVKGRAIDDLVDAILQKQNSITAE